MFMEHKHISDRFFKLNWIIFACDGSNNKILFRSCDEFDSFTENQLISFDQQAMGI